jgi:hypothetical protein
MKEMGKRRKEWVGVMNEIRQASMHECINF